MQSYVIISQDYALKQACPVTVSSPSDEHCCARLDGSKWLDKYEQLVMGDFSSGGDMFDEANSYYTVA